MLIFILKILQKRCIVRPVTHRKSDYAGDRDGHDQNLPKTHASHVGEFTVLH